MPKAKSLRSRASARAAHKPAAKVTPISESELSALATPNGLNGEALNTNELSSPQIQLSKREKRELKHQLFISQITGEETSSHLSRSALRRQKRRQKERLAADLSALKSVLELESSGPQDADATGDGDETPNGAKSKSTATEIVPGRIGESQRSKPLTKAQRKRALKTEQLRLPHILAHPSFMSDSFGTIRTHTQNVLARTDQ